MKTLRGDLPSSIAVALVALPLCLGIALASGAPLMSGLVAGIVGGLIVGSLSGSHISVAGPAAGLVAIVLGALDELGTYELFLAAVVLSGVMQLALGALRAGRIAHFVPSAVIRGLLAAIGLILILKQIPHAFGYDTDVEGDFSFAQLDGENTFSELLRLIDRFDLGAIVISILCLVVMLGWVRSKRLQSIPVPVQLVVVLLGIAVNEIFHLASSGLFLEPSHRVSLPDYEGLSGFFATLPRPDLDGLSDSRVWFAALTLALVASLETLLNLEAADRLDRHQRVSPPNRELLAQGVGNMASGALGGLPVTSVVVRSSVNAYSGAETRVSTILHGTWLLLAVLFIPGVLARIPLSALAIILILTGYKLANPSLFREMYRRGWSQFLPFVSTVVAIVFTDLLIGVLIGLGVGLASVIRNLTSTPFLNKTTAKPEVGVPARIKFGQQLTFLHRARLISALEAIEPDSEVILDARKTEYIGPEVLEIIRNFRDVQCPDRGIRLSLVGFRDHYDLEDELHYVDVFTKERQRNLTPKDALELMRAGNRRFVSGEPLERDLRRQVKLTAEDQHPFAAVLACIDSRVPTELLFDKGLGDIFSVRVAGNVLSEAVIGSLEYAVEVAGSRLVLVLGHTRCGAIGAACTDADFGSVGRILERIRPSVDAVAKSHPELDTASDAFHTLVSRANVDRVKQELIERSEILRRHVENGGIWVVGAVYDIERGEVDFMVDDAEEELAAQAS